MEVQNIDTKIKKISKRGNRASRYGCLTLLGTAGLFTYFAINKTSQPEMVFGMCMLGLLAAYGCNSYASRLEKYIAELKKQEKQNQR